MENSKNQKDRYAPEKLMQYHAAVAIVENMEKQNLISARDRRKMLTVLTRKYGFDSGSIFAAFLYQTACTHPPKSAPFRASDGRHS